MPTRYTLVEDSHYRQFLKEEGYGFVAEVLLRNGAVSVRHMNKGVSMDTDALVTIAEDLLRKKSTGGV